MKRTTVVTRIALAVFAVLATFLASAPRAAQAGGEADDPAADEWPERTDPEKTIGARLPPDWVVPAGEPQEGILARFDSPRDAAPHVWVTYWALPGGPRASLAVSAHLLLNGVVRFDADTRSGDGWWECGGARESEGKSYRVWMRGIGGEGVVRGVWISTPADEGEFAQPLVRRILDSVRAVPPAKSVPAAGLRTTRVGAFDLQSDRPMTPADRGVAKDALATIEAGRNAAAGLLRGKPFDTSRPVVVWPSKEDPPDAEAAMGRLVGQGSWRCVEFRQADGVIAVLQMPKVDRTSGLLLAPDLADLHFAGACQYVSQHFGGRTVRWIDSGLAVLAQFLVESGAKAGVPSEARMAAIGKAMKKAHHPLDAWLYNPAAVPLTGDATMEAVGWHVFLRRPAGRKYAKAYEAYIESLRTTGDVAAARKPWDGLDFARMEDEFVTWATSPKH